MLEQTLFGPMVASASPELLRELLAGYQQRLEAAGIPVDEWLAPGVSAEETRRELQRVGLTAPDELVVWFGWHNGMAPDLPRKVTVFAMPNFVPRSLTEATTGYESDVLNFERPPATSLPDWVFQYGVTDGWMRLRADVRGCAIECVEPANEAPRIRSANEEIGYPDSQGLFEAVSLCTLVTWWIESLDSGAFRWEPSANRWIVTDDLLPASQRAIYFE